MTDEQITQDPPASIDDDSADYDDYYEDPPRRTSGLGIAALILGIISLAICWIPFLGAIGVPLSIVGLILSLIAVIYSATTKRTDPGIPIAALVICAVALAAVIHVNRAVLKTMENFGNPHRAQAREKLLARDGKQPRTIQDWLGDDYEPPSLKSIAERMPGPIPLRPTSKPSIASDDEGGYTDSYLPQPSQNPTPSKPPAPNWTSSTEPIVRDGLELRILTVRTGKVKVETFMKEVKTSTDPVIQIEIQLRNLSTTNKLRYRTMDGDAFAWSGSAANIEDNFGNKYLRISFDTIGKPVGRTREASIYPGKSVRDVLIFEPPVDSIEYLSLSLPLDRVGKKGRVVFRVLKNQIRQ